MKYLLDANILIDYLNNLPVALDFLLSLKTKEVSISVVTLSEVLAGCDQSEMVQVLVVMDGFKLLDVNRAVAIKAAEFRQQGSLKLPDAYQAAIAIEHKLILLTRNTKDFPPKKFSFVKTPYVL